MKKTETVYNVEQALQLAVLVDSQQGFIKSGHGFYDSDRGEETKDNKTAIFHYLNGTVDMPVITDTLKERAAEIREYFKQSLVGKKLMGTLNSFEDGVMKSISNDITNSFGISVIASLPNSLRVAKKREDLDDWFDNLRNKSEFVGKRGDRLRFGAYVRDVKFIAKYGIHLVTCVDKDENIVKFFFSKEPDIAGLLEGRNVILTGKVKQHDVSKFSQCKETVINYVKVEEST